MIFGLKGDEKAPSRVRAGEKVNLFCKFHAIGNGVVKELVVVPTHRVQLFFNCRLCFKISPPFILIVPYPSIWANVLPSAS